MENTVDTDNILEKADHFVLKLFTEQLPNTFIYHNYNHTQRVVKSTKELIEKSQIPTFWPHRYGRIYHFV